MGRECNTRRETTLSDTCLDYHQIILITTSGGKCNCAYFRKKDTDAQRLIDLLKLVQMQNGQVRFELLLSPPSNTNTHTQSFLPLHHSIMLGVWAPISDCHVWMQGGLMTLALALWPWEPVLQVLVFKMEIILALIFRSFSVNELWQHMSSVPTVPSPESVQDLRSLWFSSILWVFELIPFSRAIPHTLIPYQLVSVVLGPSCQLDLTPCFLEWVGLEACLVPN